MATSCSHQRSLQPKVQGFLLPAFDPSKLGRSQWGSQVSPTWHSQGQPPTDAGCCSPALSRVTHGLAQWHPKPGHAAVTSASRPGSKT